MVMTMGERFAKIKGIGELTYKGIYGFYDEPLLFSCMSLTGSLYLVLRQSDDKPTWLAIEVSKSRLNKLENNDMETYQAFTEPENGYLYRISGNQALMDAEALMPEKLTSDMLPYPGEYLDYHGDIAQTRENIDEVAYKENCMVLELAFERDNGHAKEIPCSALSDALNTIQLLVYSLAYREEKTYGQFPKAIREQHELKVTETFAASFGVQLKSATLEDRKKQEEADDVLERLDRLIGGSNSSASLRETLSNESNRTAVYYNNLLKGLKRNNLGFRFAAASPTKYYAGRHLTTTQVDETLQRISNDIQEIKKEEVYDGELKGIDIDKNQFTFISSGEDDDVRIMGKISEDISKRSFVVPSRTKVRVETTISFDKLTGEEKYSFLLLDVTRD